VKIPKIPNDVNFRNPETDLPRAGFAEFQRFKRSQKFPKIPNKDSDFRQSETDSPRADFAEFQRSAAASLSEAAYAPKTQAGCVGSPVSLYVQDVVCVKQAAPLR
jgi:hypothetical protein